MPHFASCTIAVCFSPAVRVRHSTPRGPRTRRVIFSIERKNAASPKPLPVTSRGDAKATELVTKFKAISDSKEQTALPFGQRLRPLAASLRSALALPLPRTTHAHPQRSVTDHYGYKQAITDGIKRIVKP